MSPSSGLAGSGRCSCCKPPSTRTTAQRPCRDHESPTRRRRRGREWCVAHAWVSAFQRSASKPTGQDSVSDFDDGDELRGPSVKGSSGSTTDSEGCPQFRPLLGVQRKSKSSDWGSIHSHDATFKLDGQRQLHLGRFCDSGCPVCGIAMRLELLVIWISGIVISVRRPFFEMYRRGTRWRKQAT